MTSQRLQATSEGARGGELHLAAAIGDGDRRATSHQPAREVAPLDAERIDERARASHIGNRFAGGPFDRHRHSGTANANATPIIAATMPTTQKRVTIVVSFQPISSK